MSFKKIAPLALSCILAITVSACTKQESVEDTKTNEEKQAVEMKVTDNDKDYGKKYNELYDKYIAGLTKFDIYSILEKANEYFNTNEYPGNEKYLSNLKEAYKKSKEGINSFISELESSTTIENPSLQAMNEELNLEAELAIKNIDQKLERIEQIPAEIAEKSKEEFIKIVNETAKLVNEEENEFAEMIKYMNEKINKND
ncbi:MAG: hypothetical protein ACRCXT_20240 [Paraclostridium sp.]